MRRELRHRIVVTTPRRTDPHSPKRGGRLGHGRAVKVFLALVSSTRNNEDGIAQTVDKEYTSAARLGSLNSYLHTRLADQNVYNTKHTS
jgi:hypothetical protein